MKDTTQTIRAGRGEREMSENECRLCDKLCSFRKHPFDRLAVLEARHATLLARHNALMEAVHGLLGALANGKFKPTVATDGHVARIAAQRVYEINRAEVDRLLKEEL